METLESIKRHKYNGVWNNVGDVFMAKRQHAKALKAIKRAKDYVPPAPEPEPQPEPAPAPEPVVETKDLTADKPATRRRGRPPASSYQRKDMVADD